MKSRNLKAMLFGAAFAASLTFVGAQPQMPLFPALEVHAASYQDVELDSKYDFEKAFQKALDVARDSEDKNTIYRIKIPAGTYKAGSCFNVYSNTYIDMEGGNPDPYIRFIHVPFWTQRRCKENFGLHRF